MYARHKFIAKYTTSNMSELYKLCVYALFIHGHGYLYDTPQLHTLHPVVLTGNLGERIQENCKLTQ